MKKMGLLPRLIIAIILGGIIGKVGFAFPVRLLATFNGIFGNFLGFTIPLIILGFVAPGVGRLGSGAGKTLGYTAGIAYGSTLLAGTLALVVNSVLFRIFLDQGTLALSGGVGEGGNPFFSVEIPASMGVMTALVLAFTLGVGMAVGEGNALQNVLEEFQAIIEKVIRAIIIPLLPIHIAGIFANMAYAGQVEVVIGVFLKVFVIIFFLHLTMIFILYTIAGAVGKTNPFRLLKTMLPAYFTAIGTQSSAATIPVTLQQTIKAGVKEDVADFTIPLCATIHLSGSTITLTSCAMAVMLLNGISISFLAMIGFIFMLGITMVAAPGVPGGAVIAAMGLLTSMLGFDESMTSLMIALYLAQDSLGTACNVTGDGAISVIINRIVGNKIEA